MNYPHGHHHRDHNREEEEYPPPPPPHHTHERQEEDYPPQPPPPHHTYEAPPPYTNPIQSHQHYNPNLGHQQEDTYGDPRYQTSPPRPTHRFESQPEYTHVQHVSHEFNNQGFQPNPSEFRPTQRFESQPEYPHVQHVSHEITNQSFEPNPSEVRHETHHQENQPHSHGISSFFHHHSHGSDSEISKKPTFRVYSKAEMGYSLTIRNGQVILARSDPNDMFQHWIKDEKFSTRVKDEEGFPCFSLINKATGQAMKHSIGATKPVQLIPYNANALDESVLWTESKDLGDGFRCIRMVNNIRLNLDALNGDENHGGVHDGTTIVLWEWKKGPNQRWKITPY